MANSVLPISHSPVTTTTTIDGIFKQQHSSLCLSFYGKDEGGQARIRRSYSDNHICYSIDRIRASSTPTTQSNLKHSRSMGIFNFQLLTSIIPTSLRSFLFDPIASKEMNIAEESDGEINMDKRSNWIERLMQIRSNWLKEKQVEEDHDYMDGNIGEEEESDGCGVDYSDNEDEEGNISFDQESFSRLLRRVCWSDTNLFSQLACLCNMAYAIPQIKAKDLSRYYSLDFVTSSLKKKAEAAAVIKAKFDQDVPVNESSSEEAGNSEHKHQIGPSVAYEIAASAACYFQSCAKDLLSLGSEPKKESEGVSLHGKEDEPEEEEESSSPRVYKPKEAPHVATSTMTAVVAAGEKERQEAAKDLQSLHSSPCEWFVCDDSSIYTRCFIIQGSDSLASWQANLFFEPTKFEGTEVLVHRGIYEAAKGIYDQFKPEIIEHLNRYGDRAKLQFTGHSLGGSLSLLVHLMLLKRKIVKPSVLRPVVTFGSPFVLCGGQKILDELGLDESHVHCVIMHRDIVPRAFSCNYPNHVAHVLKRLNGTFQSHPCLNKNKLLYTPMGTIFILQPDEKSSPPHPLLPPGNALYALENTQSATKIALQAFLNSPHPLETLGDPTAYGSEGTILRDHDSSNYLKATDGVIKQHTKIVFQKVRKQRNLLWPLLPSLSPNSWSQEPSFEDNGLLTKEIMTGV